MKILALESSATACSVALCQGEVKIAEAFQKSGLTHSRTLLPMVEDLLKNCDQKLEEVDVIAVAVGPGSFTGLRIGVSTAKGLSWAGDKPCAPCSTLEAMAWNLSHMEGYTVICAMDARRNQVYNAIFSVEEGRLVRIAPDRAIALDDLGEALKSIKNPKIVVGDGAELCYNNLKHICPNLVLAPQNLRQQTAWGVARAAQEMILADTLVSSDSLAPVYHRLSQAERERLEKTKEGH